MFPERKLKYTTLRFRLIVQLMQKIKEMFIYFSAKMYYMIQLNSLISFYIDCIVSENLFVMKCINNQSSDY